jgi:hypothetical protein
MDSNDPRALAQLEEAVQLRAQRPLTDQAKGGKAQRIPPNPVMRPMPATPIACPTGWRTATAQPGSSMSTHPYPPVQRALEKRRALSADEEARYWAEAREKALSDEATLLMEAREEGRDEARQEMARNLIRLGVLTDAQIARVTELTVAAISRLRTTEPH